MQARTLIVVVVAIAVLATTVAASAAPGAVLLRDVVGGGGEPVSAGNLVLTGTVAEPAVGALAISGGTGGSAGFWQGALIGNKLYLPMVVRR